MTTASSFHSMVGSIRFLLSVFSLRSSVHGPGSAELQFRLGWATGSHRWTKDRRLETEDCGLAQQPPVERQGQEIFQLHPPGLPAQVGEHDLDIPAKFPQDLPAWPAWWRG